MSQSTQRLPCRGCLANCPNRATCQGKPWRKVEAGAVRPNVVATKPI